MVEFDLEQQKLVNFVTGDLGDLRGVVYIYTNRPLPRTIYTFLTDGASEKQRFARARYFREEFERHNISEFYIGRCSAGVSGERRPADRKREHVRSVRQGDDSRFHAWLATQETAYHAILVAGILDLEALKAEEQLLISYTRAHQGNNLNSNHGSTSRKRPRDEASRRLDLDE